MLGVAADMAFGMLRLQLLRISSLLWSESEPGARKGQVVTTGTVPALKIRELQRVATSPASPNTQRS